MWGIISIVFGVVEVIIGLRFLFLLLGANLESGFVMWIYNISSPLIVPFATIFGHTNQAIAGAQGTIFEPASLIALVVYGVIGGVLLRLLARRPV